MKNITVILADEEQNTMEEMKKSFERDGYQVLAMTSDGEELIDLIKIHTPDVVLMDIVLQKCDGFKVLESLAGNKKTKVIVQSSLSIDGFINKAISLGAKYYCIKPFDIETLKDRIHDVLNTDNKETRVFFNAKTTNHIEEKITNIFITVGIPAHIKGYQFLREAIKLAIANP